MSSSDLVTTAFEGLALFHPPGSGDVFEVRIPMGRGESDPVHRGFFNDLDLAARAVEAAAKYRASIYVTLNPVRPELLTLAKNRIQERARRSTCDKDIVRRCRLLIDADPERAGVIPSTEDELQAALERRNGIVAWLTDRFGWPRPALGMSGNGGHADYAIDLPNDNASAALVRKVLKALAHVHGDAAVKIDTTVANASRVCKIYGTVAIKGVATSERPYRRAEIEEVPGRLVPVTLEQLRAVAALAPANGNGARRTSQPAAAPTADRDALLVRARAYLAKLPASIEGNGGDHQLFVAACYLRDFGLAQGDAEMLLCEYNGRAVPPWSDREIEKKIANAWRYAKGEAGARAAEDRPGFRPASTAKPATPAASSPGADTAAAEGTPRAGRGRVVIQPGALSAIVDQAQAALAATLPIFQRGGLLTRAVKLDATVVVEQHVRRAAGSTVLIAVREPWLGEQMGQALGWWRVDRKGGLRPADVPALYPRTLMSRGEWPFPVLRGVVTAPTLDRDGRIIDAPGYDVASGLLVDVAPGAFPPVPIAPTHDDAVAALARLAEPLRGFPFIDQAAKSVALAALLTSVVRLSLRTAPLIGYDAPTAGTGKSLLAETAGLLATGFRPPALSQGKTAEEDEKRLSTVLFAGDPVIHLDNCEHAISGDFLCSMLTQETLQARILGQSERRILPSTALVLASGNNLTFAGDVSRRAVVCRLDCHEERPDARAFDFDCHQELLDARPGLVIDALTVLRAYHLADRPVRLTPMGGFTDWAWVRGALMWLDCADPADTRTSILENDPRKDDLIAVLELWSVALGEYAVTVAEIGKRGEAEGPTRVLREKLTEVACRSDKWSPKSVGWWLRRNKDRVVGGKCLQSEPGRAGQFWRLSVAPAGF